MPEIHDMLRIMEPSLLFLFLLFVLSNCDDFPFSSKEKICYLVLVFFIVAVRLGFWEWQLSKYLTTHKTLTRALLSLSYFSLLILSVCWIPSRKMLLGFFLALFILHFGLGHNQLMKFRMEKGGMFSTNGLETRELPSKNLL